MECFKRGCRNVVHARHGNGVTLFDLYIDCDTTWDSSRSLRLRSIQIQYLEFKVTETESKSQHSSLHRLPVGKGKINITQLTE